VGRSDGNQPHEDLEVDGKSYLNGPSRRCVDAWTGWVCFGTGTDGGLL
jgi:hypothetical protein